MGLSVYRAMLDRCAFAVQGGRLMRHWVAHPLSHAPSILARLDAVQELHAAGSLGTSSDPFMTQQAETSMCI